MSALEGQSPHDHEVGFLLNPIAGMGGRVGLKGTDGLAARARRLGARPVAPGRAAITLGTLRQRLERSPRVALHWLTCGGAMGADPLAQSGFERVEVVHQPADPSTAEDTRQACARFLERGVELVLFCGGDGTARDVAAAVGTTTPILGIPSGVKMYSGVFGVRPDRTADLLLGFLRGEIGVAEAEILDLDEERYRGDEWAVRLHAAATTPFEPSLVQASKSLFATLEDRDAREAIADEVAATIESRPGDLWLLGPGSTVAAIAERLGVENTLLGIDGVLDGRPIGSDLDEQGLLDLLDRHPEAHLVLSPIGAQGFVLGRGNLQLSPDVVRRIGLDRLILVATPAKLRRTPVLRFDTGDAELDAALAARRYWPVITGENRRRLVRLGA